MEQVRFFFLLLTLACLFFLVIGLFKPWLMLWWEDIQNRRKILAVYGTAALICYGVYWALALF
ncbi:MAG: hypothetical protein ACK4RF_01135 [Cyclobacteriaceae bacterium]